MHILIVEDETRLANLLKRGLVEEGFAIDLAASGEEAIDWVTTVSFDVILLDIMLPGIDGLTVCRQLREMHDQTPILLLTARDSIPDRVAGLDAGADDYLIKPFAFSELTARIRALSRRPPLSVATILEAGDIRLDPATHGVCRSGHPVALTNKEFRILEYFMRNPNQVLTRRMIADQVWDYDFADASNVIDVHIRTLRQKLGDPVPGSLIETIRGAGYRLRSSE